MLGSSPEFTRWSERLTLEHRRDDSPNMEQTSLISDCNQGTTARFDTVIGPTAA